MKPRVQARRGVPCAGAAGTFRRVFTRLGCRGRPPHFVIEFYPYANLTHTIRLRGDVAHVRLSDLLRGAPPQVVEAAAAILLARLFRRSLPAPFLEVYRSFSFSRAMRRRIDGARRRRVRRVPEAPRGQCHNLSALFAELNRRYFRGRLRRPRLGWSARPWRRQLGVFDPALGQLILTSRLDRPDVPRWVVAYVLYHEMLHVKHPIRRARCGLQSHPGAFRREERQFAHYARARRFLQRLA